MATRTSNGTTRDAALVEALRWAGKDGPVFPLGRDKRPLLRGSWKSYATTDVMQIRRWSKKHPGCSWALVTGERSGTVVIDLDPGSDPRVELPAGTFTVKTGRGGRHVYLRHPGTPVPNYTWNQKQGDGKLGPHIDVRGDGGYVVLAGSQNDAGRYKRVGRVQRLAAIPPDVLSRLQSPLNGSAADQGGDGTHEAGSRHHALLSLAAKLRYAGATEPELLAALRTFNDARCDPPKPDDEVERMARDYAVKDTRVEVEKVKIRARDQARIEIAREQADAAPLVLLGGTAADYLAEGDEEIAYTIDEWHPHGTNTLLVARSTAGKTSLGVNLMRSLADGAPFLGRYDIEAVGGTVSYWDYEMHQAMFKLWLRSARVEHVDRLARPQHLRGLPNPLLQKEQATEWLREQEVSAWIVDAAMGAGHGYVKNWNDNSEVDEFTKVLDQIKEASGVEDLFIFHHMGVAQFEEGDERGRGAQRLEDWADQIWHLTKDNQTGSRSMWAKGRGIDIPAKDAIDIQYNPETHALMAGATRAARREDDAAYAALVALDAFGTERPNPDLS